MKPLLTALIFSLCLLPLHTQVPDSSKYQIIDCREFRTKFRESVKPVIIDIREYKDFRKSRIKGAVSVPRSEGYEAEAGSLDKESTLFIYCYAGVSSRKAAIFFYDKGFRNIFSLKGGMMRWKGERMPLERKRLKKKS